MIITITRNEGPSELCGKPQVCATFKHANDLLSHWSLTGPTSGYDKCDFSIADQNTGEVLYTGRYDLKSWRIECANLKAHVTGYLEYHMETNTNAADTLKLLNEIKAHP